MGIGDGSHNLRSYTPARRPEASVNSRQLHGDQETEWTAARCHRLLRALTSRVAILTKDLARFQQQNRAETVCKNAKTCVEALRDNEKACDEDWLKAKKRTIKTYSTKGRRAANDQGAKKLAKGRNSFIPGEVLVPTPILARARGQYPIQETIPISSNIESDQQEFKAKRRKTGHGGTAVAFQLSGTLREIRNSTTATRYSTYEGIYNGLEALLRATKQSSLIPDSKRGRSLLSMALRAVPRYINEQEALLKAHIEETGSRSAIENRDITVEVYDDLEAYGSSGYGWKRLGVVVRAHGVQVISDAIISGVLDVEFCGALISLCIHMGAVDEGEALLSALLSSTKFLRPRVLSEQLSKPLSMLWKFSQHTNRASFQLREMSRLILDDRLPVEWLATNGFGQFWSGLIQYLTLDALDDDVLAFMEILLLKLMDFSNTFNGPSSIMGDALRNTFSSLLTTLCSIMLLSRGTEQQVDTITVPEGPLLKTLLKTCMHQSRAMSHQSDANHLLLLLANIIAQDDRSDYPETEELVKEISKLLRGKVDGPTNSARAAMLICQVARCCGRGNSSFGFDHLQQIHLQLELLACGQEENHAMKGLIVDSAFAFARKVPDRQHIDYAANMDATYSIQSAGVESSLLELTDSDVNENRSGFRWEEGIGEWVTATPGTTSAKRASIIMVESDEDSPFKPPPNLRRRVEQTPSIVTRSVLYSDNIDELEGLNENHPTSSSSLDREVIDIESESESESESEQELASPQYIHSESGDELRSVSPESSISDEQSDSEMEDTDKTQISFYDESMVSAGSPQRISSPAPRQSQLARRIVSRTPRLSRKLFHDRQSYQLFNSSDDSLSSFSSTLNSPINHREFVDRAPRLGRRALRSSQAFEVFEESDDELSFLSVSGSSTSSISQNGQPLREITNKYSKEKQHEPTTQKLETRFATRKRAALQMSDSEDELCI